MTSNVSKRSELGRATARSSGYRSEGTELIQQRPLGFGHRCQPRAVPRAVQDITGCHVSRATEAEDSPWK
jgi:hypothetical protein